MDIFGKLRNIKSDELELMLSWRNAPDVRANMYTQHEISLEEHLSWWSRIQQRNDHLYFMYDYQDAALGVVAFSGIDSVNENSSWAFYASPNAPRGTGIKMEYLALNYAFDEIKLHKLTCEVLAFNTPVLKLHQKFGFITEGVFREQHRVNDTFVDIHRLGILAREWEAHRATMKAKLAAFSKG